MNVLVACEESQAVVIAMRDNGHNAFSCDLQPCSGGHPEWHIMGDALPLINGKCSFTTLDGQQHRIDGEWDLLIAHPPCTYLSNVGACRMYPKAGCISQERYKRAMVAKNVFMAFLSAKCKKIAVENPRPLKVVELPQSSQVIEPWQFGHAYTKRTYLWLIGLPPLMPTELVANPTPYLPSNTSKIKAGRGSRGTAKSQKQRSKTFPGIARAMADQWAGKITKEDTP